MKKMYRGYSRALLILGVLVFVGFVFVMRGIHDSGGDVSWAPCLIVFVMVFLATHLPCSCSADYSGFEIKRFGVGKRFDYGSVDDVTIKYSSNRVMFCNVELTVTGSFGQMVYREAYFKGVMTDGSGEPVFIRYKPVLTQLYEYVKPNL